MNHRSMTLAVVLTALSLGVFAGCYTKLMPFRDAVAVRKQSVTQTHGGGNFTSDLNYQDNCLSCHSQAELNDRAVDMDYAGIHSVHGLPYDPYGWQNPYTQPPWWEPYAPVIPIVAGPHNQPVISTRPIGTAAAAPASPSNANRRRETGSTRTGERTRDANPTATSTPTPAPLAPTSGGSAGRGAVTTTPPPPAQTPAAAPAESSRTRSGGTEESKTRKSGSGRE